MKPADFTLTAGPTTCSSTTLAALGSPIVYHYDPAFIETFRETEELAKKVLRTQADMVLMQGEAVLGLEAAGRAVVRPGMACLNLSSGVFGKGYGDWLRQWGATVYEVAVPYDEAVDPADVERMLDRSPGDRGGGVRALRDTFGHSQPGGRHRPAGEGPRRGDDRGLRVVGGGDALRTRRLATRHLRGRGPEMSRWLSRHHDDQRERGRLGPHSQEPRGPALLVPVVARLEGEVAGRGSIPLHAVGGRGARSALVPAGSCSTRATRPRSPATPGPRGPAARE